MSSFSCQVCLRDIEDDNKKGEENRTVVVARLSACHVSKKGEEGPTTAATVPVARLSACHHTFCRPCLETWLQACESAQPQRIPTCPQCRSDIVPWDVFRILGRPLRTKPIAEVAAIAATAEMDELTEHWLEEQGAVMCPGCGAWVLRSYGCDHMTCRCGQNFCYCCGGICCLCYRDEMDEDARDAWYERNARRCLNVWHRTNDDAYSYFSDDEIYSCDECGARHYQCHCLDRALAEEEESFAGERFMADCIKRTYGGKATCLWKGNSKQSRVDAQQKFRKSKQARQRCKRRRRFDHKISVEGMT